MDWWMETLKHTGDGGVVVRASHYSHGPTVTQLQPHSGNTNVQTPFIFIFWIFKFSRKIAQICTQWCYRDRPETVRGNHQSTWRKHDTWLRGNSLVKVKVNVLLPSLILNQTSGSRCHTLQLPFTSRKNSLFSKDHKVMWLFAECNITMACKIASQVFIMKPVLNSFHAIATSLNKDSF